MTTWFDAHLDLAYLAVTGRDLTLPLDDLLRTGAHAGPFTPPTVTLPALREAGVTAVLGTIFTEPHADDLGGYDPNDPDSAREAGLRQLRVYQNWTHDAGVALSPFPAHDTHDHDAHDRGPSAPYRARHATHTEAVIHLGILFENADPIRTPDELPWWAERGVIAIGLAWATPSRYAGGNATTQGLTDIGRDMIKAIDELGLVHDVSHLSQRSLDELLEATDRPVIASHSNCRSLLDGYDQRHLTDDHIREITSRGGVIGLNLFAPFVDHRVDDEQRPTLDAAIAHSEHIRDIAGHARCIGLGSDMDGGFPGNRLPQGIDRPADLHTLVHQMRAGGWNDEDVNRFASRNWLDFFATHGPAAR
jgi:membrane dipeptidase